jgi:hypothetical protein
MMDGELRSLSQPPNLPDNYTLHVSVIEQVSQWNQPFTLHQVHQSILVS